MLDPAFLASKFNAACAFEAYLAKATPDQLATWTRAAKACTLTTPQRTLLASFTRRVNVLVTSGLWCGDCAHQVPMLHQIAQAANGVIDLRLLDRDEHEDLARKVSICGGLRVPTVIFMNEDHEFVGIAGDKSLSRLRAKAAKSLGASCPLPGADLPADEAAATLGDWVNEHERVHLLVRLSPKLRQRHGD
ncbi:MAG: thioredoxin family protein [Phycisphaerales bacterium]|nr:thioredoxin family protein [Phycisphaerales bacterium]